MIDRKFCLLDNQNSIEDLCVFNHFPVYMGCVNTPFEEDLFFDQVWGVSDRGMVQLKRLIEPSFLYEYSHTPGSVGNTWKHHHKKFFEFIKNNSFGIDHYLEIGGSSGSLWDNFSSIEDDFLYEIVEPSEQKSSDDRLKYIKGFYETKKFNKKYKCIIHSHVFEHVYNPISFLHKLHQDLTSDGVQFISIPNMKYWLSNGYTNTINFEHTFYLDEFVLDYFLNEAGFIIEKKIVDQHSVFVKAIKSDNIPKVEFDFSYIKNIFLNYINNLSNDIESIKEKVGENSFYLFGAHIFSQTLLNFGLNDDLIISILDNDPKKQSKRLYGTKFFVESPNILTNKDRPIVVLRAGIYDDEIKNQITSINKSTVFI